MSKIKTRMAELKEDHDKKQKDIAKILNVKRESYAQWEVGRNDFPILKANELANYYKVSIDYLLGISDINFETERTEIDFNLMQARLRALRKNKNINQTKLGKAIGFPQGTYSNYETGKRIPTTFKLKDIAYFHKVSFDYLVGRSDVKEIKNRK